MIITSDLINQLYITVSAAFADGLGTAESQYEKIAMVVPSSSRENVYPWLGTLPSMRKWAGDRVIRNLSTHDYSIKNEKFESTLAVKRDDLEDDQVGIYGPLFRDMGAEVKEPSPIKKAMMWSAIKMNAGADNSRANIAQMMIRGTVTGLTSLKTTMSESGNALHGDVKNLLQELITIEENCEQRLKKYL